jgi:ACR3 family arsenite efflux pump ArsB
MKKRHILIFLISVAVAVLISVVLVFQQRVHSNERAAAAQVAVAERAQTVAHAAATRASDGVNVSPAVPAKP